MARNADGTTDGITLSVSATDPEDLEYAFADDTLTFTPKADGLSLFTVQAVNGEASATKILGVTAVLPAPVALEVEDADIREDGFIARWSGVVAARNFQLQVSTSDSFPVSTPDMLVQEGFDGVTNKASLPEGWAFKGTFGTYATGGEAPPSIKLSTDGATLTTPSFSLTGAQNGLSFWTRGQGNVLTSTLTVQQLVGDEWRNLAEPFVPSKGGEKKEIEKLDQAATRIRFVMTKLDGNIAIDDVVVAQETGDVVVDEDEIPAGSTSCEVEGLQPGTTYHFRVRAIANTKSAWSEVIEVTTAGDAPIPVPDLTVMAPETSADTSLVAFWLCPDATKFRLQVSTDEEFATLVLDEEMTEISKIVTSLTPETTYYVRVCALSGERAGDWSNVESVTTASSGGEDLRIGAITIDTAAGTFTFTVQDGTSVETATDLVAGDWAPYECEIGEAGQVSIPMDAPSAYYRLVPSAD